MINADDWGASADTTDAIARCFQAGALNAASAMVHMADSARAARLAGERGLPVGLHLNLSQPFDDPRTPAGARRRQADVVGRFRHMRLRRWLYDPRGQRAIDEAIADQLEGFERLYGTPPRRLDGHLHVHLCPNVLFSRALPPGIWLRPGRTPAVRRATPLLAGLRRARERRLRSRFQTSDCFFSIEDIHPGLGGSDLLDTLDLAERADVEVMTHPDRERELKLLLAPAWLGELVGRSLSAFGATGMAVGGT